MKSHSCAFLRTANQALKELADRRERCDRLPIVERLAELAHLAQETQQIQKSVAEHVASAACCQSRQYAGIES